MNKDRVCALVSELSFLSAGHRRISERVMQGLGYSATAADADDDSADTAVTDASDAATAQSAEMTANIKALRVSTAAMEQRIRDLTEALEEERDIHISDDDLASFKGRVKDIIGKTPTPMILQMYDFAYFQQQPRSLRSTIADCLIDTFDDRNQEPLEMWRKISLSGGAL